MAEEPGNQTPNTPDVSETELRSKKVEELRAEAKDEGVSGTSAMKKDELVAALVDAAEHSGSAASNDDADTEVGAGPDGGHVRTGPDSSKSLGYSQEITSPDDEPEREGRSLVTTSHEVIKQWAESRDARPATPEGSQEHDGHLGVLRFDFNAPTEGLREVPWEEWFATFDERRLNFIYQEERSDGSPSNFFRLENPDREDG